MAPIVGTDLGVSTLCFGGERVRLEVDERTARDLLDCFVASGGNFIDTADVYSAWAEGNIGGEAETITGNWMAERGRRGQVVVATKVGLPLHGDTGGLRRDDVLRRVEGCLRRLRTDHLDLLFPHRDDPTTPLEEVREGVQPLSLDPQK